MPDYGVSDTEREILTKLDQILGIAQDLQVRQRSMEQRQKTIKGEIEEASQTQTQGSFASSDPGDKG